VRDTKAIIIGLSSLNKEVEIDGVIPDTATSWERGGSVRRTQSVAPEASLPQLASSGVSLHKAKLAIVFALPLPA
jgi:hypothetical protein